MDNIRENSNGESAFRYFTERIDRRGLYLLDEPENSLSPQRQIELIEYIDEFGEIFSKPVHNSDSFSLSALFKRG